MSSSPELTPEEKLLRVIQQTRAADESAEPAAPQAKAEPAAPPAQKPKPAASPSPQKPPLVERAEPASATPEPKTPPSPGPARPALKTVKAPSAASPAAAAPSSAPPAREPAPPRAAAEVKAPQPEALPAAPVAGPSVGGEPSRRKWFSADSWKGVHAAGVTVDSTIRFLGVIILVLLLLVVYDALSVKPELAAAVPGIGEQASPTVTESAVPTLPPLDQYLGKRNPFQPLASSVIVQEGTNRPAEIKDYNLLGVSWDPANAGGSEALVRDLKKKVTYFLKEGQPVGETDFVVGKIQRDKVVLKQKGKEWDLR